MTNTTHIAGPKSGPTPSGIYADRPQRHWAQCTCGWTSTDTTTDYTTAAQWADAHLVEAGR